MCSFRLMAHFPICSWYLSSFKLSWARWWALGVLLRCTLASAILKRPEWKALAKNVIRKGRSWLRSYCSWDTSGCPWDGPAAQPELHWFSLLSHLANEHDYHISAPYSVVAAINVVRRGWGGLYPRWYCCACVSFLTCLLYLRRICSS